jgi:hypothetical protein
MGRSCGMEGESSGSCDAGERDAHTRRRPRTGTLTRLTLAAALLAALVLSAVSPAGAAAASIEHPWEKSFPGSGTKCTLEEPGDIAASRNGEVFVYERAHGYVDQFNASGCVAYHRPGKGTSGNAEDEGLAVDNDPSSPSYGDVYVFNPEEQAIRKFKVEGSKFTLIWGAKSFKNKAEGKEAIVHEFAEQSIFGFAVDSNGDLWVYTGEGGLWHFDNKEKNEFVGAVEGFAGTCAPRPGFAIAPNDQFFYEGHEHETHSEECSAEQDVMVRTNEAGEPVISGEPSAPFSHATLDAENTTGIDVNPDTGDVYLDNVKSINEFSGSGEFAARFANSGPGALHAGSGLGVDPATQQIFAADSEAQLLNVYGSKEQAGGTPPSGTPGLADGREWEQVSPVNKRGAALHTITPEFGIVQAAEDGHSIAYTAAGPITPNPPSVGSPAGANVISRRTATSPWATEDIATPREDKPTGYTSGAGTEYRYFDRNLASAFVQPDIGLEVADERKLSPEATETTVYKRNLTVPSTSCLPVPSTCYQALVYPHPQGAEQIASSPFGGAVIFMGGTANGENAVLKSTVPLTPTAEATALYEWSSGTLRDVSTFPAEGPPQSGGEPIEGAPFLGSGGEISGGIHNHAISEDGQRVFWTFASGNELGALYMHDSANGETIRLDKPQGVGGEPPLEPLALFQGASADGSNVFFTDVDALTPNATDNPELEGTISQEGLGDLYECHIVQNEGKDACELHNLTAESTGEPANVQGVIGINEEGSTLYFVADGALAGAGPGNCVPREHAEVRDEVNGKVPQLACTIYRDHFDGSKWTITPVARVSSADQADWHYIGHEGALGRVVGRVSPNGEYLAFMSSRPLTGFNNADASGTAGAFDQELFLYDAAHNTVTCASCNSANRKPTGIHEPIEVPEPEAPLIDRQLNFSGRWLAADMSGWSNREVAAAEHQPRNLSDSGRLFFNGVDPLVPAARNEKADVYEYEPNGVGSCAEANGCVALMSSGESSQESVFLDASASGNDVFFETSQPLAASDEDDAYDVYDAHVCSAAEPCLHPHAEPKTTCHSEAECRAGFVAEASAPVPATTAAGTGNVGQVTVLPYQAGQQSKKPVTLTTKQKLAKALALCRKRYKHKKKKRQACERSAHRHYGPKKAKKSKKARRK